MIEPIDAGVLSAGEGGGAARESRRVRRGLELAAAVLPFAFLLLMSWLALARAGDVAPGGASPLYRDPLRRAEIAFETRRLRNLAQAYRFATGDWPESPGELAERGWLPAGALAGAERHPYYYARRGDGALVLAPEQ